MRFVLVITVFLICTPVYSQNYGGASITIIGDPIGENAQHTYTQPTDNTPPATNRMYAETKTIEPTLENGFHIRFDIEQEKKLNDIIAGNHVSRQNTTNAGLAYPNATKKRKTNLNNRAFKFNLWLKAHMPKIKKKYRPHICGRF